MPIVTAAVVPHSPLLIPTIAKEHTSRSAEIVASLEALGQEIYAAQPDVVIFLTPHGPSIAGTSMIEVADTFTGRLSDFGDMKTELILPGAIGLSHRLKEAAEDVGIPLILQTSPGLDYGVTVPWLTMWSQPMPWLVMPIAVHHASSEAMIRLGELLRDVLQARPERVVIVASGDTNRRNGKMKDSDRRPTVDERAVAEAITHLDPGRLIKLSSNDMCLRDPLTALLSCLSSLPFNGQLRIFDVPVTVGQIVANFTQP